ncbi:very short patch repair endonuclease [Microvirga arsenatis]|uniref:Very short patch repair endonuclease n=1 Tax=Microvirga arsenatis TaxID=2692265 RepID=A0ABW9YYI9_9HYPH|nr:very short patch repair endonuclease [Microvirga arsenatis]NBJ10919.1 DNA mismatch endonuclease Vsr [Microvirga arsenatis]NBJ24183.1 DNA mismatch endonuclease Vsr [Microvirga arsenatis]
MDRSAVMRAVKSKDTTPELVVRQLVHGMGYRYRLHAKDLPGKPDLVFPQRRKVILVNGCFWHGHHCKRGARQPKANAEYWRAKVQKNRDRDRRNEKALREAGWEVLTIWECQTAVSQQEELRSAIAQFLGLPRRCTRRL